MLEACGLKLRRGSAPPLYLSLNLSLAATPRPICNLECLRMGGDVKSAGGRCQDVPKLPEVGCLSLVHPLTRFGLENGEVGAVEESRLSSF